MKDRAAEPSGAGVTVKAVALSSPSQASRKAPRAACRPGGGAPLAAAAGTAMTTLSATVLVTLTAVEVGERLALGEGVPPRAEGVVEGEGVLLGEGRLVMDSLG